MYNCRTKYFYCFILFFISLVLSSCGSRKAVLYNPWEVEQLSQQVGFRIKNNDENIPLYAEASLWLGVPYRYAGLTRRGVDCSGLVYNVYKNVYNKTIPRSSSSLAKKVKKVSKGKLKSGDFVFFATATNKKNINHVGIFLKDGYFVHASSSRGVIISHLDEEYYRRTWKMGGKIK